MKLGNDLIKKKFDDIDEKIDFMRESYRTLQQENEGLILKIKDFEAELDKKNETEEQFSEQEALIQSKIDGLLKKLNYFSNSAPGDYQSNM
ncbi:DUF904 domain-containing protein [Desulfobacula sp.]|uniref:DUF904 domain-containing protein n=1 Tax=Desulfobacula sp. TaxID=2593537 RepID=UPI0025C5EA52|nr:DUF904 domain-containing protein [Desulfobacula sp.]MBC2705907.1 DUF904 domain-containing protein [Desulfobacula sp.]